MRGWKVKDVVLQLELEIPRQQLDFYMGSILWKLGKSARGEKERSGPLLKGSIRNSGHVSLHTPQTPEQQSIHLQHPSLLPTSQSAPEMLFENVIFTSSFSDNFTNPKEILAWQQFFSCKTLGWDITDHRIKYEALDEQSFTGTPPEFWVCFKHLKCF